MCVIICSQKEMLNDWKNHLIKIPSSFLNFMCTEIIERRGEKNCVKVEFPLRRCIKLINILF